tara:strand:+ start:260 stop:2980 length:2721 start_codon:yes stop_codon:yes gene_type:complete
MAAVNQRIQNFLGGVSQQPDFIKFPGQLRVCDNAYPDVTFGLSKRAPGEFVAALSNASSGGQWFEIIRDSDEKFVGQITSTGIKVWNLDTGAEQSVSGSFSYLSGATQPYGLQTIGDYTLITNPQKTVGTTGTTSTFNNNYAFVSINTVAYNAEYVVAINGSNLTATTKYRAGALSVVKSGSTSSSWNDSDGRIKYAGKQEVFDATSGIKFTVLVNGNNYVSSYGNNSEANYDAQYNTEVVLQDPGFNATNGQTFTVSVAGINYTVTVDSVESYETYADSGVGFHQTPKSPDKGTLSINTILGGLKSSIESTYTGVTCEIIGDGVFVTSTSSFTIEVRGGTVNNSLEVIQDSASNVSKLPQQCKNGYIAKVTNTEDSDSDDYFVKFVADNGTVGTGSWEETVAPGIVEGLNPSTMPHALVNNRNGTFSFRELNQSADPDNYWIDRQVGDITSNPDPTFVGKGIKDIFFYRNRLGFISGENVILSQPADYFNFFIVSAITTSDADPIDIAASDIKPAFLNHVLPIQKGLVLFSESAQFMLFTESDSLSTSTAQLKKLASYECSPTVRPIDLGTSVMFSTGSAAHTRVFEMVIQDETVPPKVVEQTRVIPEFIPKDVNHVSNSSQTGIASYGKSGTSTLYFYKYYDTGTQREQSSWYTWTITGSLVHSLFTAGNQYVITLQGSQYILSRHEMVVDTTNTRSYQVGTGDTSRRFEATLDNMTIASASYNSTTEVSTVTLPYSYDSNYSMLAVFLSGIDAGVVRIPDSVSGTTATFNNIDLTTGNVAIGYKYTTEIELPNFYYAIQPGKYDVDGDLRISRINFEMGISGPMEFHLTSPQVDDYIQYESGMEVDRGEFNAVPSKLYKSVKVPVHKKNEKYTLTIKVPDPFTATIVSASWDGRYDTKRHVRR